MARDIDFRAGKTYSGSEDPIFLRDTLFWKMTFIEDICQLSRVCTELADAFDAHWKTTMGLAAAVAGEWGAPLSKGNTLSRRKLKIIATVLGCGPNSAARSEPGSKNAKLQVVIDAALNKEWDEVVEATKKLSESPSALGLTAAGDAAVLREHLAQLNASLWSSRSKAKTRLRRELLELSSAGASPLLLAADFGYADCAAELLSAAAAAGPDILLDVLSQKGQNFHKRAVPLTTAIANDHYDIVLQLVKAGADIDAIVDDPSMGPKTTPLRFLLDRALYGNSGALNILQKVLNLLKERSDFDVNAPLPLLKYEPSSTEDDDDYEFMVEHGFINPKSFGVVTMLDLAVSNGSAQIDAIKVLLAAGAKPTAENQADAANYIKEHEGRLDMDAEVEDSMAAFRALLDAVDNDNTTHSGTTVLSETITMHGYDYETTGKPLESVAALDAEAQAAHSRRTWWRQAAAAFCC
jgi:ankyrin repeat protein